MSDSNLKDLSLKDLENLQKETKDWRVKEFLVNEWRRRVFQYGEFFFLFGIIFIAIACVLIGYKATYGEVIGDSVCNSNKCRVRLALIEEGETKHKSKEAIVEYALIRTIFNKKSPVEVSEYREIEKEISSLYDLSNNTIVHNGFALDDERQVWINKFYKKGLEKGLNDKETLDMLGTFLGENGRMEPNLRSYIIGKNGYYDYGLCQVNKGYHPTIVNDKRFFTDVDFQIEKCVDLYVGGTIFYGKRHKEKMKKYLVKK